MGFRIRPTIILGPPGTGKTTKLLEIVRERLKAGVPPGRIAYVSFTKKAASEAIERACHEFGLKPADFPFFRTLHSLCYRYLGLGSGDVMSDSKIRDFAAYAKIRMSGRWSDDGTFAGFEEGDRIMFQEHLARVKCIELREQYMIFSDGLRWNEVERVSRAYRQYKADNNLVDYTDMLTLFVDKDIRPPVDVVIVDESQDLSEAQWRVVEQLSYNAQELFLAGDDDQAIYEWAGAAVARFIGMPGDVQVLEQSWRVPVAVQQVADRVIRGLARRRPKVWNPREAQGEVEFVRTFLDADLKGDDVLILVRNIYLIKEHIEPWLRRAGIIFERQGGHPSIPVKLIAAIYAWERLRKGGEVDLAQAREIYTYMSADTNIKRGFKTLPKFDDAEMVTLEILKERGGLLVDDVWFRSFGRAPASEIDYIRTALANGEGLRSRPRVRINTIHGSKGGQADHVILLKEIAARTYQEVEKNSDEERRVWYVGLTRAKEKLTIVESSTTRSCPWI